MKIFFIGRRATPLGDNLSLCLLSQLYPSLENKLYGHSNH